MLYHSRRIHQNGSDDGDDSGDGMGEGAPTRTRTTLSADDGSHIVVSMPPLMRTTMTIVAVALFSSLLLLSPFPSAMMPALVDAAAFPGVVVVPAFRSTMTRRRPNFSAARASLRTPLPESRPSPSSSSSSSPESEITPSSSTTIHVDIDPPTLHHHHQQHHYHHHHLNLLRHHHHAIAWPTSPELESTPSSATTINVEIDPHTSHHHNLQILPHHNHHRNHHRHLETTTTTEATAPASRSPSHVLTVDEMRPIIRFKSKRTGKPKVLNLHGLRHLFAIILTMPLWMIGLEVAHALGDAFPGFDDDRGKFDGVGKAWCRAYLGMTDCYPDIDGDVGRLLGKGGNGAGGPCLFVANHASFLDIAVLCCVLNPTFKFIAKDSLEKFPGVGRQLVGGEHLLIDRCDKRSQLRTFKRAMKYLDDGVSIMAFPEGARSPDGRLMEFKGGMFSLAIKTGVPIVPLSLSNTHAVFPGVGFLPVQDGRGKLRVYVHDPIDVTGKDEGEIAAEVRRALLSELPWDQQPLAEDGGGARAKKQHKTTFPFGSLRR
ncbi:hypothetical protein ACHAW5_001151 [Stephanodiscus triporus]|uniref:Phospholipid/glycerol acyltransferase domain-containing protein n=1 Tax=Stephanodiscus triporus TaxID=2934178 RepID=A0ABD3QQD0_9STRA